MGRNPTSDGSPKDWADIVSRREAATITLSPRDMVTLCGPPPAACRRCGGGGFLGLGEACDACVVGENARLRGRVLQLEDKVTELRTALRLNGVEGY